MSNRAQMRQWVTAAVPLVENYAKHLWKRVNRIVELEDLRQIGLVALVEASHRYEPARNVPFEAWAMQRVRGAMIDGLRTLTGMSRSDARRISNYYGYGSVNGATQESMHTTMRLFVKDGARDSARMQEPCVVQVIRGEAAEYLLQRRYEVTEFSDPLRISIRNEDKEQAHELISALRGVEQEILQQHYLEGYTLAEIADMKQVSRSWLSRLHKRALIRAQQYHQESESKRLDAQRERHEEQLAERYREGEE